MSIENFQNVVIGSGEAGKSIAWHLGGLGQSTAVVERWLIGGACPNVACLPSKNVIYAAKVAHLARHAADFGVKTAPVAIDMPGVIARKRRMVDDEGQFHLDKFAATGCELVMGEARFIEPRTMEVALNGSPNEKRVLRGERVFLAVGSRAEVPDVPGLADAQPMTHVHALNLERLPEHLVVLGGGYVGLEFAQALSRFGSRVTVVHRGPQLIRAVDADVSDALRHVLTEEGVDVRLNTEVRYVEGRSGAWVSLELSDRAGGRTLITASDILVATGRIPNTDRLNAAAGGVELDGRGYIRVDDKLQTTAPGVWAMGECAGSPAFTHVAYDDFRVVRDNLAGRHRSTRDRIVPSCLFTDPELVHVGMHEFEAREAGVSYRLAKIPMSAVLRTHTHSDTRGLAKALVGGDDRILGFTALGAEASEMLAAAQTAMLARLPYTSLRDAIFAHPTTAEGLVPLFASVNAAQ
jgi:pyruvate/2-oxoglutarate dehydrogenase complex dihydrolipoamide dehydrogenase (E3) component